MRFLDHPATKDLVDLPQKFFNTSLPTRSISNIFLDITFTLFLKKMDSTIRASLIRRACIAVIQLSRLRSALLVVKMHKDIFYRRSIASRRRPSKQLSSRRKSRVRRRFIKKSTMSSFAIDKLSQLRAPCDAPQNPPSVIPES